MFWAVSVIWIASSDYAPTAQPCAGSWLRRDSLHAQQFLAHSATTNCFSKALQYPLFLSRILPAYACSVHLDFDALSCPRILWYCDVVLFLHGKQSVSRSPDIVCSVSCSAFRPQQRKGSSCACPALGVMCKLQLPSTPSLHCNAAIGFNMPATHHAAAHVPELLVQAQGRQNRGVFYSFCKQHKAYSNLRGYEAAP